MQFSSASFLYYRHVAGTPKATSPKISEEARIAALNTLGQTIIPTLNATTTTSTEIDWSAGHLPWDRYTLPLISPNGLHATVQLGTPPSTLLLSGTENEAVKSTTIELHILDPVQGRRISPLHIGREGLLLTRAGSDTYVLVESPNGENGRWIGQIEFATGNITWIVADENINAFPTINNLGEMAWSRRSLQDDRFHLVVKTLHGQRVIDDGESDWLMPAFLGNDRLRVYTIADGKLSLQELDVRARDPLLTTITLPIVDTGATRELIWQIATTNSTASWHDAHAFYHPARQRMVVWQPNEAIELASFIYGSVAASPVQDGSWLVALDDRMIRQEMGSDDGIHIRNRLAIPVATTSEQWTHLMLIPEGNRLEVRAINLDK